MSWKKEVGRKAFHLSWGLVLWGYLSLESSYGRTALFFPLGLLLFVLIIDFFRIEYNFRVPIFHGLLRTKEATSLFTPTTTMMGITIALAVFDQKIAIAAILIMVFGDVAGNIVGRTLGKHKLRNGKSIEGSSAEFIVAFVLAYLVLSNIYLAVVMAITATLAETFTSKLDDNMISVLSSGAVGQMLLLL